MRRLPLTAVIVATAMAFAPIGPAALADSWTGWYIGLNAGGVWGGNPVSTGASTNEYCPTCAHALDFANASIDGATGMFPVRTDGFIGGGQFGYNWQLADRWVAGFEADFQGLAGAGNSGTRSSSADVANFANHSVTTDLSVSKRIDFLATVRGRLGFLVMPNLLVFGTGGFAYGHVNLDTTISQGVVGSGIGSLQTSIGTASNTSRMQGGWTLGGGFEWMFASNWTAKVEYLHYDLGSVTSYGQIVDIFNGGAVTTLFVNDVQSTTRFYGDIVRVGLNYRF